MNGEKRKELAAGVEPANDPDYFFVKVCTQQGEVSSPE